MADYGYVSGGPIAGPSFPAAFLHEVHPARRSKSAPMFYGTPVFKASAATGLSGLSAGPDCPAGDDDEDSRAPDFCRMPMLASI